MFVERNLEVILADHAVEVCISCLLKWFFYNTFLHICPTREFAILNVNCLRKGKDCNSMYSFLTYRQAF